MNTFILYIVAFQIFCSVICAIRTARISEDPISKHVYNNVEQHDAALGGVTFAGVFLLLNTFIPISLVVTLEVCKVFQARYITNDWELFSKEPAAVAQSPQPLVGQTNIIEELGQISYIFSDKTGTLTRNEMSMKAFCIGVDNATG